MSFFIILNDTIMKYINWTLWLSSLGIVIIFVHQLLTKNGTRRHRTMGYIAMILGIIIFVTVTIRGFANKEPFNLAYAIHLLVGLPFFYLIFRTGYLGHKAKNDPSFGKQHRRCARLTAILLAITLLVGIIATLSHQRKSVKPNSNPIAMHWGLFCSNLLEY